MAKLAAFFSLVGEMGSFGMRSIAGIFVPPFEWRYLIQQIYDIGAESVGLIGAAGLALGVVMTLHTRSGRLVQRPILTMCFEQCSNPAIRQDR